MTLTNLDRTEIDRPHPLLEPSSLPHQLPDFAAVAAAGDDAVIPAFRAAFAEHDAEIAAIVDNPEAPTFDNTVVALERSGQALGRVAAIFFNLAGTDATESRQKIEATIAPELSAHLDRIRMNDALYQRLNAVTAPDDDAEGTVLLEKLLRDFTRSGAGLSDENKQQLAAMNNRLSELSTKFGENLLADTQSRAVLLTDEAELAGLSTDAQAQLAASAKAAGHDSGWLVTLDLPTVQPILLQLENSAARKKIWEASIGRGQSDDRDNEAIALEMVRLRAQRAELLGYKNHADWTLVTQVAGSAAAAQQLMDDLAPAAAANAAGEWKEAADLAAVRGHDGEVAAWDWPYWAEQLRKERYSVDTAAIRPYLELNRVLHDGVFHAAHEAFGITITERDDLNGYADDVHVYEVTDADGSSIGLLLTDYFARPVKRGGAWMSSFVDQSKLLGTQAVVINVLGIAPPAADEPTLLTPDEVRTLFHEFGHGLHGLLSNVTYPTLSGTSVPRDFVEFPSQLNENYAWQPELVRRYARHVDTGEAMPEELRAALVRAEAAGQGFATSEQLAASLIDMAWHSLSSAEAAEITDVAEFETQVLQRSGLNMPFLAPRYRTAYFNHIFAGGYSAGYYSYMWAEAMDADTWSWLHDGQVTVEKLTERTQKYRDLVLSKGGSIDYTDAYRALTGHDVSLDALLQRRGLVGAV
ncbi:M3 family metallopeptidase [Corynebacterium ulceribovis]|uniref:M3 family metallopeptidase n=1 Tax=Corynebacterium ulceribovis TaxID=487732 RepID=UPI000368851D|nr:M3 family metallopeptidase [Corynebacterium ulceribovis]